MKRIIKISYIFIMIMLLSFSSALIGGCNKINSIDIEPTVAKNVILLIGDGMGANHIEATKIFKGIDTLNMETMPYSGFVDTSCALPIIPTDSAAAASAMATGEKVFVRNISMKNYNILKNITEYAMENGKKTGIIATKDITDATPAAFSAHAMDRGDTNTIMDCQISSNIDLFIGQGKSLYDPYKDSLTNNGYTYINDKTGIDNFKNSKLFAMFDELTPQSDIKLNYLTSKAIETLNKDNDKGFFLMVEGSKIDSQSHSNEFSAMVNELIEFDLAIKSALDFAKADKNTLVIVCADHETGNLKLPENPSKDNLNNDCFHSPGHTSQNIKYFSYGITAKNMQKNIDNTDIFKTIMQAFNFNEDKEEIKDAS